MLGKPYQIHEGSSLHQLLFKPVGFFMSGDLVSSMSKLEINHSPRQEKAKKYKNIDRGRKNSKTIKIYNNFVEYLLEFSRQDK